MATCATCQQPYNRNCHMSPICRACADREKVIAQLVREEERLEAKMGPVPEYVR